MKSPMLKALLFYPALAVCLWPLYLNATRVVSYVQLSAQLDRLARIPPKPVLLAAALTLLTMWAIGAGIYLFRKNQTAIAWLVVLLTLAPLLTQWVMR